MSRYYLCQEKKALHPYYIQNVGVSIYTIEELCFYLHQNVYLIDQTIVNPKLCQWLEQELGLASLGRKLGRQLEQEEGRIVNFMMLIFKEAGYLTPREAKEFREQITRIEVQPEDIRRKLKADHLVSRERYSSAVYEYYRLLQGWNEGNLSTKFFAAVLNNMAAAYAGMHLFEEAADCLWRSYELVRSGEVWRRYLMTLPLYLDETEYQQKLDELVVPGEQIQKLEAEKAICIREYLEMTEGLTAEEILQTEKAKYRKSSSSG